MTEVAAEADGYLILLPYLARENGTCTGMAMVPSPWGAPLASGLIGTTANGDPWLGLINESPVSWLRVGAPIDEKLKERLHIQRLAVDCRAATGYEAFHAIVGESEPPDFTVVANGREYGWELTEFAIPQRRHAQRLFFEVTARLGNQQRHRISHLSGYQLYMWFGAASDAAGLPFRRNDETSYSELVEEIVAHIPDPDQFRAAGGVMPERVQARPVRTAKDAQFFSVPLLGGAPASGFYAMTGMHAGLAFQSDHTAGAEWARLQDAIKRKDRPGNDVLLISAGAPDNLGQCFLSEEVLAAFLLEHPGPVSTEHLSSVILHFWSTGRAVELVGERPVELWPALFQGWTPSFHPFMSRAT